MFALVFSNPYSNFFFACCSVFTAQGTHVLTNPAQRMVSQGGTVDWFRFWLTDEEDPDPSKAEQYARRDELGKMLAENDAKDKTAKEPAPVN